VGAPVRQNMLNMPKSTSGADDGSAGHVSNGSTNMDRSRGSWVT